MPYGLILLIASLLLGVYYVAVVEASRRSRIAVATILAVAWLLWWEYPQWIVVSIVLQLAVSLYVLVYLKAHPGAV